MAVGFPQEFGSSEFRELALDHCKLQGVQSWNPKFGSPSVNSVQLLPAERMTCLTLKKLEVPRGLGRSNHFRRKKRVASSTFFSDSVRADSRWFPIAPVFLLDVSVSLWRCSVDAASMEKHWSPRDFSERNYGFPNKVPAAPIPALQFCILKWCVNAL